MYANVCKDQAFPGEYLGGLKMSYHRKSPKYKSLRHEIRAWINEEGFHSVLRFCKQQVQTQIASKHTCCSNNDHYAMRFGHQIGIEHALALFIYCVEDNLCGEFRETYRGDCSTSKTNNADQIRQKHYDSFYWLGKFLYEAAEFFGSAKLKITKDEKGEPEGLYVGVDKRVLFSSCIGEFYQPTSTTKDLSIAASFAQRNGQRGLIMELSNQWKESSAKNSTRCQWASWISPYSNEDEYLLFGYSNTVLIVNIHIWNYSQKQQKFAWRSLRAEMNALNYWCQITMGYAGQKDYNVRFDKDKFKKTKTQRFLAKLIEYELNPNANMSVPKTDGYRYIHQLFHHIVVTKTGKKRQQAAQGDLLEVDFRGIRNEGMLKRLKQHLFENPKAKPEKLKIAKWKIAQLYPNLTRYADENGKPCKIDRKSLGRSLKQHVNRNKQNGGNKHQMNKPEIEINRDDEEKEASAHCNDHDGVEDAEHEEEELRLTPHAMYDVFSLNNDCEWHNAKFLHTNEEKEATTTAVFESTDNVQFAVRLDEDRWRIKPLHRRYQHSGNNHAICCTQFAMSNRAIDMTQMYYSFNGSKCDDDLQPLMASWMQMKHGNEYVSKFFVILNDHKLYQFDTEVTTADNNNNLHVFQNPLTSLVDLNDPIQELRGNKEERYSFIIKVFHKVRQSKTFVFKCATSEVLTDWLTVLHSYNYRVVPHASMRSSKWKK